MPASLGTFPTTGGLFTSLLVGVIIIVGALIASAAAGSPSAKWLGLVAVALASVNIFGGFAVTARMLAMYKKKDKPVLSKAEGPAPVAEKKA